MYQVKRLSKNAAAPPVTIEFTLIALLSAPLVCMAPATDPVAVDDRTELDTVLFVIGVVTEAILT